MKKVLAIIVSYNFEPWLKKCLDSLTHSTIPLDILVIDNKSTDDTTSIIKTQYTNVDLIKNTKNFGFGGGNNIGLKKCVAEGYDYAFLVNQDAWIAPNCLEEMLKITTKDIGIISPMHLDGTGQNLDAGFQTYIQKITKTKEGYNQVKFVNAAFWLIPKETILKVGIFSPIFHHYGEDVDLGNRLKYHNLNFIVAPNAIAYHDRQNRTISLKSYIKSEFTYFLTEYCNINNPFYIAFFYAILAPIKKSWQASLKRNGQLAIGYLKITISLLSKTYDVLKTRKINKIPFNNHVTTCRN